MKLTSTFRCASETNSGGCAFVINDQENAVSSLKGRMSHDGIEREREQEELTQVENVCKDKQTEDPLTRRRKSTTRLYSNHTSSLTKRSKSASDLLAFAVASLDEDDSSCSSAKDVVCSNSDSLIHIRKKEDTIILGSNVFFPNIADSNEPEDTSKLSLKTNASQTCCCYDSNTIECIETLSSEPKAGPIEPDSAPTSSLSQPSDKPSDSSSFKVLADWSKLDPRKCSDIMPLSPDSYIQQLFHSMLGYKPTPRLTLELSSLPYNSTRQPFIPPITEEHMANYDLDVVSATRDNNLSLLQELFSQGRSLSCCNRYGESLLHMACRRGFEEIVTFLTQDAGVAIRITDDCGRTPLHDALWNRDCQYGIVDELVRKDPSLLLLCDKHGHTPFEYARREHWDVWKQFLWDRREHMMQALDMDVMELFRLKI